MCCSKSPSALLNMLLTSYVIVTSVMKKLVCMVSCSSVVLPGSPLSLMSKIHLISLNQLRGPDV